MGSFCSTFRSFPLDIPKCLKECDYSESLETHILLVMFSVSSQNHLSASLSSHIHLIQSGPLIRCCSISVSEVVSKPREKNKDSSVCWPVKYLSLFSILSLQLFVLLPTFIWRRHEDDMQDRVVSHPCIPPCNYPVI